MSGPRDGLARVAAGRTEPASSSAGTCVSPPSGRREIADVEFVSSGRKHPNVCAGPTRRARSPVPKRSSRGTATLAWTVYPSRLRWLLPRVAFTVGAIVVLVAPAAFAADLFERARQVPAFPGGMRIGVPRASRRTQSTWTHATSAPSGTLNSVRRRAQTRRAPANRVVPINSARCRTGAVTATATVRASQARPRSAYQVRSKPCYAEWNAARSWA